MLRDGLWPPCHLVQLIHVLVVGDTSGYMPDSDAVLNTQTWAGGRSQNMLTIRTPFAHTRVTSPDCGDLGEILFDVVDIHLSSQVTKASYDDETPVRREDDGVTGTEVEAVDSTGTLVENGRLGWHISIDNTEFLRVWRPGDIVDWTFFV